MKTPKKNTEKRRTAKGALAVGTSVGWGVGVTATGLGGLAAVAGKEKRLHSAGIAAAGYGLAVGSDKAWEKGEAALNKRYPKHPNQRNAKTASQYRTGGKR